MKPHFLHEEGRQFYGVLESGASDVYTQCGFKPKVLPCEGLDDLLVHHLSNRCMEKLEHEQPDGPVPITLTELKRRVKELKRLDHPIL